MSIVGTINPYECEVKASTYFVVSIAGRYKDFRLGTVTKCHDGWRFFPTFQANPSRRGWETPEAALLGRVRDYELVAKWETPK